MKPLHWKTTVFVLLAFTMVGCYQLKNQETVTMTEAEIKQQQSQDIPDDYVGATVPQAQALAESNGVPFRISMADGEPLAVTMDFRPGRINATVEDGVVVSYSVEGEAGEVKLEMYDANSWKTMISDSCKSFFDGCNNCNRMGEDGMAACTRKACAEYQEPRCLDAVSDAMEAPSLGKRTAYLCDEDARFTIFHDEYVSGDAIVKLESDQVMMSDQQDRTAYLMNRVVSASGEKYESAEGRVFWSKGSEAMVMMGEEDLYTNCMTEEV